MYHFKGENIREKKRFMSCYDAISLSKKIGQGDITLEKARKDQNKYKTDMAKAKRPK